MSLILLSTESVSEICLFCSSLEFVSLSGWLVLVGERSKSSGSIMFLLNRQILELIERVGRETLWRSGKNPELSLPHCAAPSLGVRRREALEMKVKGFIWSRKPLSKTPNCLVYRYFCLLQHLCHRFSFGMMWKRRRQRCNRLRMMLLLALISSAGPWVELKRANNPYPLLSC